MDKLYTDFIKNYDIEEIKTNTTDYMYTCAICLSIKTDEFPIYTLADIGRVCSRCYRESRLQALILSSLMDDM